MNFLIDSDILISAAIGRGAAQDLINDAIQFGATISIISLGEVYEGAVDGLQDEDRAKLDFAPIPSDIPDPRSGRSYYGKIRQAPGRVAIARTINPRPGSPDRGIGPRI